MPQAAIDFLTFRMDVFNNKAKLLASDIYEQSCSVSLRDLRLLRIVHRRPAVTQGEVSAFAQLDIHVHPRRQALQADVRGRSEAISLKQIRAFRIGSVRGRQLARMLLTSQSSCKCQLFPLATTGELDVTPRH